ncbi:la-related protein 6-like [Homarus americanus]|uniref:La-related protein 6-like 3 n=1 Tax=Homarus americanus TaxID=6706 RepID=A0A8J5JJE8_HOMAM|nr:la-related protein 6-like [Homarus americanus]KAG7159207.1 La-related protein 6-like 3 [Homarus americanus]
MLSLLSRIVTGSDCEECQAPANAKDFVGSSESSSLTDDTDEEELSPPMPIINIDQTELAEDALHLHKQTTVTSVTRSDSSEDVDDSPAEKDVEVLAPVVLPSQDVCRRILELVEYYLSEHNLVKDMFLLKHVTKHHEGYVSIKLLTSYKKVKRLTKDWRVVAHALKASKTLEINENKTKVRRVTVLSQELEDDTRAFRTLLATNIAREDANMNNLAEFFAKFGELTSLQMHKPNGRSLEEVRLAEREHPGIINTICAIVEYERVHCARQALRSILNNSECNMKALELPRKKRETKLSTKTHAEGESAYYSTSDMSEPTSPESHMKMLYKKNLRSPCSSLASSPVISPVLLRRHRKPQHSSPESSPPSPYNLRRSPATPSSSPEDRPVFFPRYEVPGSSPLPRRQLGPRGITSTPSSPNTWRQKNFINDINSAKALESAVPAPLSPWLRRRVFAASGSVTSNSVVSSPSASPSLRRRQDASLFVPENVTRLPRGPDGTRGFLPRQPMVNAQA